MASTDPRDPVYGKPYVGTPVQQAPRSGSKTVLDMLKLKAIRITVSANDNFRTSRGTPYHE